MVQRLDHHKRAISEKIYAVFQSSYAVEAKLLGAIDFPPLKRSSDHLGNSNTVFYGVWQEDLLVATIEIKADGSTVHMQSLVVDPDYFRQGLAKQLIAFTLQNYTSDRFTVETGVDNAPAIALYTKFGFVETHRYNTGHGIRKVRFEKTSQAARL